MYFSFQAQNSRDPFSEKTQGCVSIPWGSLPLDNAKTIFKNKVLWNNLEHVYCNVQGVARHWRNPVRTGVTPLDSSDALYIVF